MPRYKLSPHVRFRKETSYVLVCDCKRLLDYQLPLEYYPLLVTLKTELDISCGIDDLADDTLLVLQDLISAELICDTGLEPHHDGAEDVLSRLIYKESEFF